MINNMFLKKIATLYLKLPILLTPIRRSFKSHPVPLNDSVSDFNSTILIRGDQTTVNFTNSRNKTKLYIFQYAVTLLGIKTKPIDL